MASQRIEVIIANYLKDRHYEIPEWLEGVDSTVKRGSPPTIVEWAILAWVAGMYKTGKLEIYARGIFFSQ